MATSNDPEEEHDLSSAMESLTTHQALPTFGETENILNQIGNLLQGQPNAYNVTSTTVTTLDAGNPPQGQTNANNVTTGVSRPGTVDTGTLELMLAQANQTFVQTRPFKDIRRLLEKNSHVTICGASGEGKTMMGLMLGQKYIKQGYELVFVNKPDAFDLGSCLASRQKICLIFDDIFSSVSQSTDHSHIQSLCDCLKMHIDHNNLTNLKRKAQTEQNSQAHGQAGGADKVGPGKIMNSQERGLRVIFTTKSYNFKEGMSKMQYQRLSLFNKKTVVDLTLDPDNLYSSQEKTAIFKKHREMHPETKLNNFEIENVIHEETTLFGFPLTCRLFFEFSTFTEKAVDFFRRPLYYLRIELNNILSRRNNQAAALILVFLCEENIKLPELETPNINKKLDEIFLNVATFANSASRSGVAHAARSFRGTFLSRGDNLCFAHSSIYEACACVLYQFNPSFVLRYCSLDFLYERLKPGHVDESGVSDNLHYLFVSEEYFHFVIARLIASMKQGLFSKTAAHPMHQNKAFVETFLEELRKSASEGNDWVQLKEKGKAFLYWIVHSKSTILVQRIRKVLLIEFTEDDINEGILASVESNSLAILKHFVEGLENFFEESYLNRLLVISAERSSKDMVSYLLKMGAKISGSDKKNRNFLHLLCIHGRSNLLKFVINHFGKNREGLTEALQSLDEDGRTPLMLAALHGTWDCFKVIQDEDPDICNLSDKHGDHLIHLACMGGSRDIVERVLTNENVNIRGQYGGTPLMVAAREAKAEVFDFLLSNNADVSLVDDNGHTLLHVACHGGNKRIVENILTDENINIKSSNGMTPIMIASIASKFEIFDLLLSNNADISLLCDSGNTLLHLACIGGSKPIVERLLTPENINSRGHLGRSPIMVAAASANSEIFELLLFRNADTTLLSVDGDTLLNNACLGGNKLIIERLLTPENINSRGYDGRTPIMTAAASARLQVFDLLFLNNADTTLTDNFDNLLLHLACHGGNEDIVKKLLTPDNINDKGNFRRTPIMGAAACARSGVFDLLVSRTAEIRHIDAEGNSLLHLACLGGSKYIVEHLLTPENINNRGNIGRTPIMIASAFGKTEIFELLLLKNADTTVVSDDGETLLNTACIGGSKYIVERLLTPENINSRGFAVRTPIMVAAFWAKPEIFELLLLRDADTTLLGYDGETLLNYACLGGNKHIVELLLTSENINSRGCFGRSPIMTAAAAGKSEVFELLFSKNAVTTLVDDHRNTLLHLACLGGSKHIVEHVLTPENINSRGHMRGTPIMEAAFKGRINILELLYEKGADLTCRTSTGRDVVAIAEGAGETNAVKYLKSVLER